ncbi:lasso RiPP family leader peptide-containing protein [Streptomyces iconiensis]|uniref:Lasso RiPP family leader peptide-containing protein n=1 Tax=Streptomyces iconiensis TaxID=1384038 RepID=A0ABT6ZQU7_9ACTN|nr:lasso RiPP family leader peptide-containing protein [Streptomyces iconiensis]MDJ1131433.1 lasso RiPP family leader peptide-containing protein [Streptomyces iconiensis]
MEKHETVEVEVYEPPAMLEAGEFAEVTLGPPVGPMRDRYFRSWHH